MALSEYKPDLHPLFRQLVTYFSEIILGNRNGVVFADHAARIVALPTIRKRPAPARPRLPKNAGGQSLLLADDAAEQRLLEELESLQDTDGRAP